LYVCRESPFSKYSASGIELSELHYPVSVIVKVLLDSKLAFKVVHDKLFKLMLDENMIVSMVHCSFLLDVLDGCLNEGRVFRVRLFLLLFLIGRRTRLLGL